MQYLIKTSKFPWKNVAKVLLETRVSLLSSNVPWYKTTYRYAVCVWDGGGLMLVQQQPHADKGNIKTARLPSCKNCVSLDELLMINVQPKLVVSAGAASASLIVTASIMSPCVFRRHKSHICFLSGARGSWTITLPTTNATLEHSAPRLRSQRDGRGTVAQTHTHT